MNARGIDVSHHQAPASLNWSAIASEHAFVYARATYGTQTDRHFVEHITAAQAAGMRVGGYHFFRQTQPVDEQIQALFATLDDAGCGEGWLPPCIDVERNEHDGELDPALYRAGVRAMLDACIDRYGAVVVYCNRGDWTRIGEPDWFRDSRILIWVAHWDVPVPTTPGGLPWSFWQTGKASIVGSTAPVDVNQFAGAAQSLPLLVVDTEPPTAPDTDRPPPPTIDEQHAVQLAELEKVSETLSDGLMEVSAHLSSMDGKLGQILAMVTSTNATLTEHHRVIRDHSDRLHAIERAVHTSSGNGAAPAE